MTIGVPGEFDEPDILFQDAVKIIIQYDKASPSLLQRRLSIGYARAARLMDQLEQAGVIGEQDGAKPRNVLIKSIEELGIIEKRNELLSQHPDVIENIENYKIPINLKLSKLDNPKWGRQFADVVGSKVFKAAKDTLSVPIGIDDKDKLNIESLLELNNLIVVGNTLSQKETFVDTFLLSLLLRKSPVDLRFILTDTTHYLDLYNGIPHLLTPVINSYDKNITALRWASAEMDRRLKLFGQAGVRNISSFNEMAGSEALPRIVTVTIQNFYEEDIIDYLTLLTGNSAKVGIHNLVMSDRTNEKGLPNSIKNNIPARVAFRVTSASESRAVAIAGAETLEPGEIIYKPNFGSQEKLKAIYTPEVNVNEIIKAVKQDTQDII